ncbi:lytic transglycosylase domain-containing protein [Nocardioides sp. Bht2]|uniref:lytic transglycosylase domain-containing protein n=1 Tax=Nocardioides sp. Bht2 TaxID=3392297 RepID=UPI0039B37D8C
MSKTRFSRGQKATALVPLALLSTAWTASLIGVGGSAVASASGERDALPDGATVPAQAIEDPASYSQPGSIGLGVPEREGNSIVRTSSTSGIPSAALAAYQRAATVINSADKTCGLDWQLVAAIGRVESDHGRYGGNTLGTDGVSRPGIYGIALDGNNGTQEITDTDAGQFDNDEVYDRAVGPMQFIPTTWSSVGVDADGDGKRNPQDIDDAALATAVYLCAGTDDLGTDQGRRSAVHRYNHSDKYVDLVLRIRDAYLAGDYSAVPNNTTSAINFTPDYSLASPNLGNQLATKPPKATNPTTNTPGTTTSPTTPTDPGSEPGTENPSTPGKDKDKKPLEALTEPIKPILAPVLSLTEALNLCSAEIERVDVLGLLKVLGLNDTAAAKCANQINGKPEDQALGLLTGIVKGLLNLLTGKP